MTQVRESKKPRETGITMMMDRGLPMNIVEGIAIDYGQFIDFVKIGFASVLALPPMFVRKKMDKYEDCGIAVFCGGTTLEHFLGKLGEEEGLNEFIKLAKKLSLKWIEVSNGTIEFKSSRKREVIKQLTKEGFRVISEVGKKKVWEDSPTLDIGWWLERILRELEAGSEFVILEARESGSVGIYNDDKKPRKDLIEAIAKEVGVGKIMFEAPESSQQIYLINRFGPDVNLGNIRWDDILALETLRRGLRSDTFQLGL